MNNKEKIDMFAMRLNGATYAEISERYGISRQRVEQILHNPGENGRGPRRRNRKYPNLDKWIRENNNKATDLADKLGININTLNGWLKGYREPKVSSIKKVLSFTGMTFEEAFAEVSEGEKMEDKP